MRRMLRRRWAAGIFILIGAASLAAAQAGLSVKDILRRNIEASGGKANLARVKTLSFRTGGTLNVVSSSGELKALTGKDPVITEAILVAGGRVVRNSLGAVSEITGPQATVYRTMAKLYAGLFSLARFEGQLQLVGVKSFGPEKFYHLTPKGPLGSVAVHFYLRADDFLLRRLVFLGATAGGDKYEVNYDFAPFEEVEGLKLPLSWFASQVGTRGNLTEMTEVKANAPLNKGFFAKAEINAGRTEASPGQMKGNVLDVNTSPLGLAVTTNWMKKDADEAGFKTGDRLVLRVDQDDYELAFYAQPNEVPPPNELAKGTRLLARAARGGETYSVLIIGGDAGLQAKLKVLSPISVKKTGN